MDKEIKKNTENNKLVKLIAVCIGVLLYISKLLDKVEEVKSRHGAIKLALSIILLIIFAYIAYWKEQVNSVRNKFNEGAENNSIIEEVDFKNPLLGRATIKIRDNAVYLDIKLPLLAREKRNYMIKRKSKKQNKP